MIRNLLSIAFALFVTSSFAQCENNYDFGDAGFGVSPDPELGESFAIGTVGEAYSDTIHILVPSDATDVDETLPGVPIDSLALVSVEVEIDGVYVDLADIGLGVVCNNNGDSPDECTFMGAAQYCSLIEGTPTVAGTFPLQINVLGWAWLGISTLEVPITFDQYSITIQDEGTVGIFAIEKTDISVGQNSPNPFSGKTNMNFTLGQAEQVTFTVMNLLGEEVHEALIDGKAGKNTFVYHSNTLRSGIYLYSFEANGRKITKRMVIN